MEIQITTYEHGADFRLFAATNSLSVGDSRDLGSGIAVEWRGTQGFKALDYPEIIHACVNHGQNIADGLIGAAIWEWLRANLKQRPKSVEIDSVTVEFEEGAVKRLISERINSEKE